MGKDTNDKHQGKNDGQNAGNISKAKKRRLGGGNNKNVKISKALSWVLRHSAPELNISMGADGYVALPDLMSHKHPKLRGMTLEGVKKVVDTCDKQRFSMCQRDDVWYIRANQGHSIKTIDAYLLLTQISPEELASSTIIHGTYTGPWTKHIKEEGLSRMNRTHIHFAQGMPKEEGVISGMRKSCDVYIHIDGAKCSRDGIRFWISANKVILTSGVDDAGVLPSHYFSHVISRSGEILADHRTAGI